MFKYYFRTVLVSWRIYGIGKNFFKALLPEGFMKLFVSFTLLLDNIFFRSYRSIKVKKPVFIIGHPRSGTTFLHHLFASTDEVADFKTWHILFPSLTSRVLMKPLINAQIRKGQTEILPESTGHKISLDETEEEEILFMNNYDTQFTAINLLGFDEIEYPELHFHDLQPYSKRMRSMKFLDGCFKRQIHYTGRQQIIAQTHFSTMRIKTMMEYYPDSKYIYIVRNPHQVVPSFFSLLYKSLDVHYGMQPVPKPVLERYYKRRYQAMIDLYRYFYELQKNGEIPSDRVIIMSYDELRNDLQNAFEKICVFLDIEPSEALKSKVTEKAAGQKHYQRKHEVMQLEQFGVTHEMISKDFDFVFKEYGIVSKY